MTNFPRKGEVESELRDIFESNLKKGGLEEALIHIDSKKGIYLRSVLHL